MPCIAHALGAIVSGSAVHCVISRGAAFTFIKYKYCRNTRVHYIYCGHVEVIRGTVKEWLILNLAHPQRAHRNAGATAPPVMAPRLFKYRRVNNL
jgi:hypothetical protein